MDSLFETDLFYMIFVSAATRLLRDDELSDLLETCRRNNERRHISGLLLYYEGNFIEIIEGPKSTIEWLFHERVTKDLRHRNIIRLASGRAARRCFPGWSMGYKRLNQATVDAELPGFNRLLEERRRPELAYPDLSLKLRTFLQSFYRSSGLAKSL